MMLCVTDVSVAVSPTEVIVANEHHLNTLAACIYPSVIGTDFQLTLLGVRFIKSLEPMLRHRSNLGSLFFNLILIFFF